MTVTFFTITLFLHAEKLTVTIYSKPHPSLMEGERLNLTCQANESIMEIRWTKDDVPLNTSANIQLIENS